jgi:hypothetical protein
MATSNVGFNINSFVKGSPEEKSHTVTQVVDAEVVEPTKRGRRKKKDDTAIAVASPNSIVPESSMSYVQQNIPYAVAYQDTNKQLDDVINDLNMLGSEVIDELHTIRASKTLKNKYTYINDMTATASSIISAKLAAIKEKNTVINNVNRMELDRLKQLKVQASEEDENTRIANLYDAFVNTPVGVGVAGLGPSMQDMIISGSGQDIDRTSIGLADNQANWEQSLDPANNRMLLEARGNIETVVMYDESTGNRWFDVVDKQTRQSVPNVERPDNTYIYDLDINIHGGYAKDSNLSKVYPLVVVNADSGMSEY